jgi:type II secretory pathway component HofQ
VKDVSLKELLEEISRQSGLSVVGSGSLDEKITIEFHNLPLDEGLRLILRHHSFALD